VRRWERVVIQAWHSYTLASNQFAQPGACKRRGMDEDVLSPAILTDQTKSLVGFV